MKIEVFRGKGKKKLWYFHLKADNGRILCASEGYTRKESAIKAITRIMEEARDIIVYVEDKEIIVDMFGGYY